MARKKRANGSVLELFLVFPWWLNLLLAPSIYGVLEFGLAEIDTRNPLLIGMLAGLDVLAPLIAGFVLLIGLGGLLRRMKGRWRRRRLLNRQRGIQTIRRLDWKQFEQAIGEAFRRRGYRVSETSSGADQGVDLVLKRGRETVLVQCKHWRSRVGVGPVRELLGVVKAQKADRGVVVCSAGFTRPAAEFGRIYGVELVDGMDLDRIMKSRNCNGV